MIKIKFLFLVLFLFVFQFSFSFAQHADKMIFIMESNGDNQLLFENAYITQDIFGEIPKNHLDVLYTIQPSKCFLSNNNSKDFHFSIDQSNLLFNSVMPGHLITTSLSKKVINVPIYLQTESFRL
jgi:hypothetical protein